MYFMNHPSVVQAIESDRRLLHRETKEIINPARDIRLYNCIYDPVCLTSMELGMPYECPACGESGKVDISKYAGGDAMYQALLNYFKQKRQMTYKDFKAVNAYWARFWQNHPVPEHAPSPRLFSARRTNHLLS